MCVLLSFAGFYWFICLLQFPKEVVNSKGCMYECRGISALKFVPHPVVSLRCVAVWWNRWHVALTLFFFALRFTSLMLSEWSGWTRWVALKSSLWGHVLSCIAAQTLQAPSEKVLRSLQYGSVISISALKSWSHLSIELPLRFWWETDVSGW